MFASLKYLTANRTFYRLVHFNKTRFHIFSFRRSIGQDTEIALDCDGAGPAVFLLHGVGGHRGQWTYPLTALSEKCATFAWDARGYGDTLGPQVNSMQDFADDFLRTLDSLKLNKVIAVGHSMGGRILMEVCALNPDRLVGMVLSGSQASYLAHLNDAQRLEYASSRETLFVNGAVSEDSARHLAQQVLPAAVEATVINRLSADFMRLNRQGYLDALRASAGWDRSDILSQLKMPVAVLGGALDTVCPPAECVRIAELVGQGPAVILDGIGHMAQIEAPQLVTKHLDDFISAHAHLSDAIDTQNLSGDTK